MQLLFQSFQRHATIVYLRADRVEPNENDF